MNIIHRSMPAVALLLTHAFISQAHSAELKLPREGWTSWQVAAVDGAPAWCCWNNSQDRDASRMSCKLDGSSNGYGTRDDEKTDTVKVYARLAGGKIDRLQVLSASCPVETKTPIQELGSVAPDDSARWLIARAKQSGADAVTHRPLGESALAALAMHRGDLARDALAEFARGDARIETRKSAVFWLAMLRGNEGADITSSVMFDDKDAEVRKHAAFAIAQTKSPRAAPDLIRQGNTDKVGDVRAQAWFWLAHMGAPECGTGDRRGAQEGCRRPCSRAGNLRAVAVAGRASDSRTDRHGGGSVSFARATQASRLLVGAVAGGFGADVPGEGSGAELPTDAIGPRADAIRSPAFHDRGNLNRARGEAMKSRVSTFMFIATLLLVAATASADEFDDTVSIFKNAGESGAFFEKSYAYAVFPTVGKGGFGVGAAHGSGRVYAQGKYVGDVKMNQVSIGLQAGGQAFSQIVFFEDKRSFDEFARRQLRVRRDRPGRCDYGLSDRQRRDGGRGRGRGRRQEGCGNGRGIPQGNGRVHRGQGRLDVPGRRRRAEVQIQGEIAEAALDRRQTARRRRTASPAAFEFLRSET